MSNDWLEHTPRHDRDHQAGILAEWGVDDDATPADDPRLASAIAAATGLLREVEGLRAEVAESRDMIGRIRRVSGATSDAEAVAVVVAVVEDVRRPARGRRK